MKPWYQRNQIRNLVDMHIPNEKGYLDQFDPVTYAENVKKSGATCAYVYSCNCLGLCFYPTKIGLRHQAADRDIFGQTVAECRKRGLDVVGYANTWATFVADQHPQWQSVNHDGTRKRDTQRFGTPCVNNDQYVQYVCDRSYELMSLYKLDGFWLDMVGTYAPICHCAACQSKYEKRFGRPLPKVIDRNSPETYQYLKFKQEAVTDYLRRVKEAVHKAAPGVPVIIQTANAAKHSLSAGTGGVFEVSDFLSGDFYTNRPGVNVICRMLYKASNNLPFDFMTSRCVSLERHTMNKDLHELIHQAYAALMYKGAFLFIDAIDPDGQMNADFYTDIAQISREMEKYLPHIDFDEAPVRDVAVYYNLMSWLPHQVVSDPYELNKETLYGDLKKLDNILAGAHIDYDLVTQRHLSQLKNYKALILPNLTALSDQEAQAIREYVAAGGNLYVSGQTSLYDDTTGNRGNFILSDLLGLDYQGSFDIQPGYLSPTPAGLSRGLFGKHTPKYPHMLEEKLVKVAPNDQNGRVLATVTLPVGDVSDHLVFSSAISDPPIQYTAYPALYEHSFGKGRVIYSAGFLEIDPLPDTAQLLTALIHDLVGQYRVRLEAPACVDFTAYEKQNRLTLHLLNSQDLYPPLPIGPQLIAVQVCRNGRRVARVEDITGGTLSFTQEGDTLCIRTDLEVYKQIHVVFEK